MTLPHEEGQLAVRAPQYTLELGVAEVFEDPDRSDVLRLQYRIADETGRVHIADAFLGAEGLWSTLAGNTASVNPPHGELAMLHENAKIFVDGRDDWVFIFQEATPTTIGPANIAIVREKYLSADLSIHCRMSGSTAPFYASVRSSVEIQRLDGSEIRSGTEFWYEIPAPALLWNPGLRRAVDDYGDDVWWEDTRLQPITFRASDDPAEPNEGVTLELD